MKTFAIPALMFAALSACATPQQSVQQARSTCDLLGYGEQVERIRALQDAIADATITAADLACVRHYFDVDQAKGKGAATALAVGLVTVAAGANLK